jgi:hypothetical protein
VYFPQMCVDGTTRGERVCYHRAQIGPGPRAGVAPTTTSPAPPPDHGPVDTVSSAVPQQVEEGCLSVGAPGVPDVAEVQAPATSTPPQGLPREEPRDADEALPIVRSSVSRMSSTAIQVRFATRYGVPASGEGSHRHGAADRLLTHAYVRQVAIIVAALAIGVGFLMHRRR